MMMGKTMLGAETDPAAPRADAKGIDDLREHPSSGKKRKRDEGRGAPMLPWMRVPIEIKSGAGVKLDSVKGLHSGLRDALFKGGYKQFFPVQAASWQCLAGGTSNAHDLCICAPTGSGKTLAYAIPILNMLHRILKGKLGALVVLPTRELAVQVFDVFAGLCVDMGLWVGLAAARLPLAAEAAALKDGNPSILVATPGRLMSHLKAAKPTVSLQDVMFLVIDETDRLLRQAYQDWLPYVLQNIPSHASHQHPVKIVLSATLTQDPAKLQRLQLHAPRYIALGAEDNRYKVPKELKEYKLVGAAVDKPVLLCCVLEAFKTARIIIFTASLAANHRLYLVLRHVCHGKVAEHSSSSQKEHSRGEGQLNDFKNGRARILVTSDALTRGVDIPGVDLVVNYDAPTYPKTYVHRAGRTARAGNRGVVITILTTEQVHHYKAMLRKVDNTFVKDFQIEEGIASRLRKTVKQALELAADDQ